LIDAALALSIEQARQEKETRQQGANPATAVAPVNTRAANAQQIQSTANLAVGVIPFRRAVKYEARGRVALVGPAGSGKSLTMLVFADALGKKIAAVDTEHGSLSKYADLFEFDVIEPSSYSVESLIASIDAAEAAGYDVFCIDSLSHYWMGADGALEFVDRASKRQNAKDDSFAGWKLFRPQERRLIDRIIGTKMHVIVTMRVKTEYAEQEVNGKKKRVKIGLKPIQTEGLEYEFDVVGAMDEDNTLLIDKTRCPAMRQGVYPLPDQATAAIFREWLKGVKPEQRQAATAPEPVIDRSAHPAEALGALDSSQNGTAGELNPFSSPARPWKKFGEMIACFKVLRERVGDVDYYAGLEQFGVKEPNRFRSTNIAIACYQYLLAKAELTQQVA